MKRIITALMVFALAVTPVFADVDSELASVKTELKQVVRTESANLSLAKYPIGSVYRTYENLSEEEVGELMGGEWKEISLAFLWATDGSQDYTVDENNDLIDDSTSEPIDPLHKINMRGGKSSYNLVLGVGGEDDRMSFWTDEASVYGTATAVLSGVEALAEATNNLPNVVGESGATTEIMPPYTVVRTFERIS